MDHKIAAAVAAIVAPGEVVRIRPSPLDLFSHELFRVTEQSGRIVAVKVGTPDQAAAMHRAVAVGHALKQCGLSICKPIGTVHLVSPTLQKEQYPVSVWQWENGTHVPPDDQSLQHLGMTLGRLHACRLGDLECEARPDAGSQLRARWGKHRRTAIAEPGHPLHQRQDIEFMDGAVELAFQCYASLLEELEPRVLCHGDLKTSDILFRPGRAVLLDLDLVGELPEQKDFAELALNVMAGLLERRQLEQVLRGYPGRLPRRAEIARFGPVFQVTCVLGRTYGFEVGIFSSEIVSRELLSLRQHPGGRPEWFEICGIFPE